MEITKFVDFIQKAIHSANESVKKEQLKILQDYFEELEEDEDHETLAEKVQEIKDSINESDSSPDALRQLEDLNEWVKKSTKEEKRLRPKHITIQVPQQTTEGVKMKDVHVPLLAILPITGTHVSEAKLRTEVYLREENNQLMVDLREPTTEGIVGKTSMEITITPENPSEGLKNIVAEYTKCLKAQMPV